jgi:small subunit ribosomal protein S18
MSEQSFRRPRRRFVSRPKTCQFCSDSEIKIDYKNVDLLRRFVTDEGKIRPRRQTGTCAKHQRAVAAAVKRSRHIALLPYTSERWQDAIQKND